MAKWGTDSYWMLLEFALFDPYADVLYRESEQLLAQEGYGSFWFKVAVSIKPKAREDQELLKQVLIHVAGDAGRRSGVRALAMDKLARLTRDPAQLECLFRHAADADAYIRSAALHALGTWIRKNPAAGRKESRPVLSRAVWTLSSALKNDKISWVRDLAHGEFDRIERDTKGVLRSRIQAIIDGEPGAWGAPPTQSNAEPLPRADRRPPSAAASLWPLTAGAGAAGLLLGFAAAAVIFRRRRAQ